jgi:hypothetical protein
MSWKDLSYKEVTTQSNTIGIGSGVSNRVKYTYDKVYIIKDLKIAFSFTRPEFEKYIKNNFRFKNEKLIFDW